MIGKATKSLRKLDQIQQKSAGLGFVKIKFAHKATGGEDSISLNSLVTPSEYSSNGFVNPTPGQLLSMNMFKYRNNLTLKSSSRGVLTDYFSYKVTSNATIQFLGFTLDPNEIIEGLLDQSPKSDLMVVDGQPIAATGTLALSATDFNVGLPFEINKFPTQQIGAVKVYRDGLLQARCEGNSLSNDGNYIEVPVSGGLGTLIRFKDVGEPNGIIVTSNGSLIERPQDSFMAAIERIAGQIDTMVPTLSALAGVPETNFQSAPNNVDLKSFGDSVLSQGTRITSLEKKPVITKYTSGSGTHFITAGCRYVRIRMVGGGGGGAGAGASSSVLPTAGGSTTFGSGTAGGGSGASFGNDIGGTGGSATLGSGWVGVNMSGNGGWGSQVFDGAGVTTQNSAGTVGGAGPWGGQARGPNFNNGAGDGAANSGAGGNGAGNNGVLSRYNGASGAAGGHIDAIITAPLASYAWTVGSGGSGGVVNTGINGGGGGSGVIIVEEYF